MKLNLRHISKGGWIATLLLSISIFPSEARNQQQMAGNLTAYPYLETAPPQQTAPPAGYEPFHLEHYGRHGSRWLIGANDYKIPVEKLEKAEKRGLLTEKGKKVLDALRKIQQASVRREGELTDIGALQHQAIGRRMALNFPEIFNPEGEIDAKSTVVIRCILSMANALQGIESVAPGIRPTKDASYADMWFMNYDDKPAWTVKDKAEEEYLTAYKEKIFSSDKYLDGLITDPVFARDSVSPGLLPYLYWVLANTQSHTGQPWLLEEVFPEDELAANWRANNASWFIHGGNSAMTGGRMPYTQRKLLGRIIERTDSAIVSGKPGANLRFGHDGILLNLVTLMELGDYGQPIDSLEELESLDWNEYDIIPMGGNLQLVFYRPTDGNGDILVKALLNEREISMPGKSVSGPYYRWNDLRDYYLKKLTTFEKIPTIHKIPLTLQ